ncbi:AT-hook motif nuclear-localized protein 10-like [Gastrolobium bilobum]|uniref:AT-hook motif nuclear-localized protein 10-like n=1 Tax=Gastrolobium bilobum TaxID=150636 RepID=UPI002AB19EE7|nr:AT-hook motif nuclear-localized protein 10-like [Gastrolobium bilobum]
MGGSSESTSIGVEQPQVDDVCNERLGLEDGRIHKVELEVAEMDFKLKYERKLNELCLKMVSELDRMNNEIRYVSWSAKVIVGACEQLNMVVGGGSYPDTMTRFAFNNNATHYDGLTPCDSVKKKRGRPRKYSPSPAGNIALGLTPTHVSCASSAPSTEPLAKKNRGRPSGSVKKQLNALGTGGTGFTPHVILVDTGEDIAAKIMAFCQQGPRTVCILSANGAICNVTLRQPAVSGGTVTYEDKFEIISLSGSLLLSENNSGCSRTGGLSVVIARSDGLVLGGGVAGMLTAASPVQVIVGSFIADSKKSSSNNLKSGPSTTPSSQMLTFDATMTPSSPISQGPSNEYSDDNDNSPFSRGPGLYNNASQPTYIMPAYHHQLWAGQTQQ